MADMRTASGKIGYLRVHDVGTGYRPLSDLIDGECIIKFIDQPNNAYGFQLRNDEHAHAHNGMLDLYS